MQVNYLWNASSVHLYNFPVDTGSGFLSGFWFLINIFSLFLNSCSHLRENTIASLKNAHAHGADMVEFDIQLSKDKIPVIYHDFELCTTSLGKNGEHKELIPMQLKNLTLAQLRGLKVTHLNKYCD